MRETKESADKKSGKLRWLMVVAAVSLAALLYMHFNPPQVHMPAQLVGTWRADNPHYADRPLEIRRASVTFTTGPGTETTGFVDDIQTVPLDGKTLYTISYSEDGTHNQVSFYYANAQDETIRLKNQEGIVWRKVND